MDYEGQADEVLFSRQLVKNVEEFKYLGPEVQPNWTVMFMSPTGLGQVGKMAAGHHGPLR